MVVELSNVQMIETRLSLKSRSQIWAHICITSFTSHESGTEQTANNIRTRHALCKFHFSRWQMEAAADMCANFHCRTTRVLCLRIYEGGTRTEQRALPQILHPSSSLSSRATQITRQPFWCQSLLMCHSFDWRLTLDFLFNRHTFEGTPPGIQPEFFFDWCPLGRSGNMSFD